MSGRRWILLGAAASVPMVYFGTELAWSWPQIALILGWGLCVSGIAVEIDRRTR